MRAPSRGAAVVGVAALALVAAAAVAGGRPWLAALALLGGLAVLQLVLLSDATRRATGGRGRHRVGTGGRAAVDATGRVAHRAAGAGGHLLAALASLVARVAGLVIGALAFYLVLTPVGLGARLLGLEVLPASGWHRRGVASAASRRRAFVTSREARGGAGGPRRWRPAVALVALGALLATAVPALIERGPDDSDTPVQLRGATYNAFEAPALADADWLEEAGPEFTEAGAGLTYTPYVGNSLRDYEGRYVNVSQRRRRSYETGVEGEAIDVWFFGGSTMFGFSAQRDLHTIPSEVVRLAEDDGIAVRAHNFGSPGWVNMQETALAAQLLAAGERPDLIVFYDGINDTAVQFQQAFGGTGVPGDPTDLTSFSYRRLLAGQLTGTDLPPTPVVPGPEVGRPPSARAVIAAIVEVYERGVELATALGEHYGIPVVHFWQPDLFNKEVLVEGEDEVVRDLGLDQFRYDAIARIFRAVPPQLPPPAIDITDAFDGVDEPLLTDQAHTNELGARLVAEAMYEHLDRTLGALEG